MKRLLLALLLAAACKHSTSSSSTSHTETSTVTDSTSSESGSQTTVTTTIEAPGKTTTTVEEYAPSENMPEPISPDPALTPHGADGGHSPPDGVSGSLSAGHSDAPMVPAHGPLVKRTVTVTERGAETTETHQQASTQGTAATETKRNTEGDTKTKGKSASGPSAGCIGASWLWGAAILAGVVGVLYFAVKMRKSMV